MASEGSTRILVFFSLLIIAVGVGWLLSALEVMPGVDWLWTGCLLVLGVATFVVSGGVDKVSLVFGPLFLFAGVMSVFRQAGALALAVELPVLVIALGVLRLVAQHPAVPTPRWVEAGQRQEG